MGVERGGVSNGGPLTRLSVIYIWTHSQRVSLPFTAGNNCQAANNRDKEWVHFPSRGASLAEAVILRPFVPVTGSPALFAACPGVLSCHSFLRVHSNIWGNYFLVGGIYNPSFLKVTNSCNSTTMKERYKGKFLPASLFPSLQPTSSDIEVADACWMEPISQGPNTSTVSSNLVYL